MDAYVARQPIFTTDKRIFGYELLFRDGTDNFMPEVDGDEATCTLLASGHFGMGLDRLAGEGKALINFTRNLLLNQSARMLPKDRTVVEVLEDVQPDAEVVAACRSLKDLGYPIALDDFVDRPDMAPLVALADIIKVDFRALGLEAVEETIRPFLGNGVRLLAEKVETHEEFRRAVDMGFHYFQGYFFCKPEVLRGREISSSRMAILQVMAEIQGDDIDYRRLESVVSQDVGMSYKLLHLVNSAFYRRSSEISTLRQALVILGEVEIRRFLSMVALSRLVTDKPEELVRVSFIRGKFMELAGELSAAPAASGPELFTLGLFSLLDAILDRPMASVLSNLPLSAGLSDALAERTGDLAPYIRLAECYESGDWGGVQTLAQAVGADADRLPERYAQSCEWGEALSRQL